MRHLLYKSCIKYTAIFLANSVQILIRNTNRCAIVGRMQIFGVKRQKMAEFECLRRRYIADWISHGRKHRLENHLHEIWRRHQECGFVLACDGSEDDKLHFRDGKPFHLFNAFL